VLVALSQSHCCMLSFFDIIVPASETDRFLHCITVAWHALLQLPSNVMCTICECAAYCSGMLIALYLILSFCITALYLILCICINVFMAKTMVLIF
jgi:hypothetical protein